MSQARQHAMELLWSTRARGGTAQTTAAFDTLVSEAISLVVI